MLRQMKWVWPTLFVCLCTTICLDMCIAPVRLEKLQVFEQTRKRGKKGPIQAMHKRYDVTKTLLRKNRGIPEVCYVSSPYSELFFTPSEQGTQIYEKMECFSIEYDTPTENTPSIKYHRAFHGESAVYDLKQHILSAGTFHFSIGRLKSSGRLEGSGKDFSFHLEELKPCFSAQHFSAQFFEQESDQ